MASLTRTFQRSPIGDEDHERIRAKLEREAIAFFNAPVTVDREADESTVTWTFTTDNAFPLQHLGNHSNDIGFSDMIRRVLGAENTRAPMADRTGARGLTSEIRNILDKLKGQIDATKQEFADSASQLSNGVDVAKGIAKEVKNEAAELQAALGQLSNSPPE